ncbi:MAG: UDP binding domain-containing protein, partial [Pikeienuella sp.]
HCIGVDPFYLTYKAQQVGYHPEVILSGRRVNDQMGVYVANRIVRNLMRRGWEGVPRIAVLGVTFKPDVPDTRNTRVADLARELKNFGMEVQLHDPMADAKAFAHEYGLELTPLEAMEPADAVVLAVGHRQFAEKGWDLIAPLTKSRAIVADLSGRLDRGAAPEGVTLWRL